MVKTTDSATSHRRSMSFSTSHLRVALQHLRSADPVLSDLIERVGPFRMKLDDNRFRSLVRSIISQQISGSAARAIRARLERLVAPRQISPEVLTGLTVEQLRSAGLSLPKTKYLLDLATKVRRREVRLRSVA